MTVAQVTELSAASPDGFEAAIGEAIERAPTRPCAMSKVLGSRT